MANSNNQDQAYACVEKCAFEPFLLQYSGCSTGDFACACGNGAWNHINDCLNSPCSSYRSQVSASANSYCNLASQASKPTTRTVTITSSGTSSSTASYATTTFTLSITVSASASGAIGSSASNNQNPQADCESTGLGAGAVAGIAVGSLLIGFAIALIAACIFFRTRSKKPRREYAPEIQQPTIAYRPGGAGASAAPLLVQPTQQGYASSGHSNVSGYSDRFVHGVPTMVGRRSNEDRLGTPTPSYNPEQQKFAQTRYQPLQGNGAVYADPNAVQVEHDGRETGYWSNR